MYKAEDARKKAKENKIDTVMSEITRQVTLGKFEAFCKLDYVQIEILEELGYVVDPPVHKGETIRKITW